MMSKQGDINSETLNIVNYIFWRKRLKFNTYWKYGIIVLYILLELSAMAALGISNFFKYTWYLTDTVALIIFAYSLYIGKKIPERVDDIINKLPERLFNKGEKKNYIKYVNRIFKPKTEKIAPIFPVIGYILFIFLGGISANFKYAMGAGTIIYFKEDQILFHITTLILSCIYFSLIIPIICSAIFLIINTFRSIDNLGKVKESERRDKKKDFSLSPEYRDLKKGIFEIIGRLIISFATISILLFSLLGIVGLFYFFYHGDIWWGYFFMGLGFSLASIMVIVLYKNTIHIHKSIVTFKYKQRGEILDVVQEDLKILGEKKVPERILILHNLCKEIDDIYDWPFNPSSIKKFLVTALSAVGPFIFSLILSFMGLA